MAAIRGGYNTLQRDINERFNMSVASHLKLVEMFKSLNLDQTLSWNVF